MTEMSIVNEAHPNWKTLPVEILHKTFSLNAAKESCEIALVCKSWTHSAQTVLYSYVTISTLRKLKSFQNAVQNNPKLGKNVKFFVCRVPSYSDTEEAERDSILTTLLSMYLPNVESFDTEHHRFSYLPVLDALLDSQLARLQTLTEPSYNAGKGEIANYTTCALLMRGRLDTLQLWDRSVPTKEAKRNKPYFDRLYNKIQEFEKLRTIDIRRDTNEEIQVLENVVEACKTLERIKFDFFSPEPPPETTTSSIAISKLSRRPNIESISGDVNTWSFSTVLSYIIHKFPKLQTLQLGVYPNSSMVKGQRAVTQLFEHMSKIDDFSVVGLPVRQNAIWDAIGGYWATTAAKLGSKQLKIHYNDSSSATKCQLSLRKRGKNSMETSVYPSHPGWKHINFIEDYGKYLGSLDFGCSVDLEYSITDLHELPENFMAHLMKHCPRLKSLTIEGSILERLSYFDMDLHKKFSSLSELNFQCCMIYAGVLEPLSFMLPKLKKLCLGYGFIYCPTGDISTTLEVPDGTLTEIIMPHTTIDLVVIEGSSDELIYIKVYALASKKYHRYLIDFERDDETFMKDITEEEFSQGRKRVYICCRNKPDFYFEP